MPDPLILYNEITSSTMDDAREAVRRGHGQWTICMAGHQTGGRGRVSGRRWDDEGQSLLFTVLVGREQVTCRYPVTQLMALALCRYLELKHGLQPTIKWPNDVLLDGRKIAGILVEQEQDFLLAGMGMNISQTGFPEDLRRPAVSLGMLVPGAGEKISPDKVLEPLLDCFKELLMDPPAIEEVSQRLYQTGEMVSVVVGDPGRNESVRGNVEGLGPDGALLIRLPDGDLQSIYSGELN